MGEIIHAEHRFRTDNTPIRNWEENKNYTRGYTACLKTDFRYCPHSCLNHKVAQYAAKESRYWKFRQRAQFVKSLLTTAIKLKKFVPCPHGVLLNIPRTCDYIPKNQ